MLAAVGLESLHKCTDSSAPSLLNQTILMEISCADLYINCDFQQCGILTSVDSDEALQPPFKLRNSKWFSASSLTILEYSSD